MNLQPVRYDNIGEAGDPKLRQAKAPGHPGVNVNLNVNGPKSSDAAAGSETLAPATSAKLMEVLRNSVDVRPEVVQRGRALASDPSYPSTDIFREIAKRLLHA